MRPPAFLKENSPLQFLNMLRRLSQRTLAVAALLTLCCTAAFAQDERDAARFSFLQPQGTARSIGFGNALGSIGGDFSTLAVNPAGIGIYRSSEITFSPSLTFSSTGADYLGHTDDDDGSHFAFSNIGLVTTQNFSGRRAKRSGWTSFSFGLGLTRTADFTRDYSYSGINTTSSGSFIFEADANQNGLHSQNTSLGDLGYQTYLINLDSAQNTYFSVVNPSSNAPVKQLTSVRERGGISELGITLGGSYQDRLMIGATLGIPIVRYERTKTFSENDLSTTNNYFSDFTYTEDLRTRGAGVNLKLGVIVKPSDIFRFGVAVHTPTYLSLTDVQNQSLTANTEDWYGINSASMLENQYDYHLLTPWRAIVSGTVFLGKYGFLTADYEFVDYSSARFGFDPVDKDYETAVNDVIRHSMRGASNVRTGLELRFDNFQLRGGFGYYGNPYKNNSTDGSERLDFSGGFGFRFERAFVDLGFVHHMYKNSEQPYYLSGTNDPGSLYYGLVVPTANLNTGSNTAVLTVGFKL